MKDNNDEVSRETSFSLMRKLIIYVILLFAAFYITKPLVDLAHKYLFNSDKYITYSNMSTHTKWYVVAFILAIIGFRVIKLTKVGIAFFSITLIVSISGVTYSSLAYQAADENVIVHNMLIFKQTYEWTEVNSISTHIYREDGKRAMAGARSKPREVVEKYVVHLSDGRTINLWGNIESTHELHQIVKGKGIEIEHNTKAEYFEQRFINYFKDDYEKARDVFGINGEYN